MIRNLWHLWRSALHSNIHKLSDDLVWFQVGKIHLLTHFSFGVSQCGSTFSLDLVFFVCLLACVLIGPIFFSGISNVFKHLFKHVAPLTRRMFSQRDRIYCHDFRTGGSIPSWENPTAASRRLILRCHREVSNFMSRLPVAFWSSWSRVSIRETQSCLCLLF